MSGAETLIQIGMRAVIRDIQDYVDTAPAYVINANELSAYLLALLITAGGYDDGES